MAKLTDAVSCVGLAGKDRMISDKIVCSVVLLSFVLGACGETGRRSGHPAKDSGVVVSPLSVDVEDPGKLLSVNVLSVERPLFRGVPTTEVSEEGLQSIVQEVAEETLSMKIVGSSKPERALRADGVLRTEILTMQELKGSSVGGEPARVAFRMGIYRRGSPQALWQANYVFRQEAFSDNWLKLGDRVGKGGSGAGWITAQEIFRRGVTTALRDLNKRRDAQFQGSKNAD
jgi:hypothetical protein